MLSIENILEQKFGEPDYNLYGIHFGRGNEYVDEKQKIKTIHQAKSVTSWKIDGDNLIEIPQNKIGTFFDEETYIIKWKIITSSSKITSTNELVPVDSYEDCLFFYWRGVNAPKGTSPLPSEITKKNPAVERIVQWSEPTVFLRIFSGKMFVHRGNETYFTPVPHLYILCGELESEARLYEVPCCKASLRSKSCFILVDLASKVVTAWHGNVATKETQYIMKNLIANINDQFQLDKGFYQINEIFEGNETEYFLDTVKGHRDDYFNFNDIGSCKTPRLFYFNRITGNFNVIEVENIYRSQCVTNFPFLQSHIYSAKSPALFLFDTSYCIWIWCSRETTDENSFEAADFETVVNIAEEYSKRKGYVHPYRTVTAEKEPLEFTNLFPYWNTY